MMVTIIIIFRAYIITEFTEFPSTKYYHYCPRDASNSQWTKTSIVHAVLRIRARWKTLGASLNCKRVQTDDVDLLETIFENYNNNAILWNRYQWMSYEILRIHRIHKHCVASIVRHYRPAKLFKMTKWKNSRFQTELWKNIIILFGYKSISEHNIIK